MMQTGNPVLTGDVFPRNRSFASSDVMTINGTVVKTLILLLCVIATAAYTWSLYIKTGDPTSVTGWLVFGAVAGFIIALVTAFKKTWAPVTAPLYALAQGLFLGGISALFNVQYPGIAVQAIGLTFGTLAVMLFLYESGIIRATEKFKLGVFAATGAIFLIYLVSLILSFFGIQVGFIYESGIVGIGFSLFVVTIAALNLVIDFDVIEQGAATGAPKYMEWYGAFALMVTLIWLYLEILRLLSKMRSNR